MSSFVGKNYISYIKASLDDRARTHHTYTRDATLRPRLSNLCAPSHHQGYMHACCCGCARDDAASKRLLSRCVCNSPRPQKSTISKSCARERCAIAYVWIIIKISIVPNYPHVYKNKDSLKNMHTQNGTRATPVQREIAIRFAYHRRIFIHLESVTCAAQQTHAQNRGHHHYHIFNTIKIKYTYIHIHKRMNRGN